MEDLFVYGSLRLGFWNFNKVLKHRISNVQKGTIKGTLYQLPEGYPVALAGNGIIHGEVFTLSKTNTLKNIDLLEGYIESDPNSLYTREKLPVLLENGDTLDCWFYKYINERYALTKGKRIAHGDWSKFILSQPFK